MHAGQRDRQVKPLRAGGRAQREDLGQGTRNPPAQSLQQVWPSIGDIRPLFTPTEGNA